MHGTENTAITSRKGPRPNRIPRTPGGASGGGRTNVCAAPASGSSGSTAPGCCSRSATPPSRGDGESLPSTTNQLEGGTNAVVKRTLDHHRGLSEEHMKRCCEWTVYMLTEHPDPMSFVTPDYWKSTGKEPAEDDGPTPVTVTGVQLPAAGVDAYEGGFGIRKGWGGRSR